MWHFKWKRSYLQNGILGRALLYAGMYKSHLRQIPRRMVTPLWQRKAGKNPHGGLNSRGRASYNDSKHHLRPPNKDPRNKRHESFCRRSAGQLRASSAKTQNNPKSRINLARRAWNCHWTQAAPMSQVITYNSLTILKLIDLIWFVCENGETLHVSLHNIRHSTRRARLT